MNEITLTRKQEEALKYYKKIGQKFLISIL